MNIEAIAYRCLGIAMLVVSNVYGLGTQKSIDMMLGAIFFALLSIDARLAEKSKAGSGK